MSDHVGDGTWTITCRIDISGIDAMLTCELFAFRVISILKTFKTKEKGKKKTITAVKSMNMLLSFIFGISVQLFVSLSVYLSVCLSVCLSVSLSLSLCLSSQH